MANPADPTQAVVNILAVLVGAKVATEWAPHATVLVAGALGAYLCFLVQPACTRAEAFGFVLRWTAVAWVTTSATTALVVRLAGLPVQADEITAAVALGIGWIGPRWPAILASIAARMPAAGKQKDAT